MIFRKKYVAQKQQNTQTHTHTHTSKTDRNAHGRGLALPRLGLAVDEDHVPGDVRLRRSLSCQHYECESRVNH